jgi:hypothetical protein
MSSPSVISILTRIPWLTFWNNRIVDSSNGERKRMEIPMILRRATVVFGEGGVIVSLEKAAWKGFSSGFPLWTCLPQIPTVKGEDHRTDDAEPESS